MYKTTFSADLVIGNGTSALLVTGDPNASTPPSDHCFVVPTIPDFVPSCYFNSNANMQIGVWIFEPTTNKWWQFMTNLVVGPGSLASSGVLPTGSKVYVCVEANSGGATQLIAYVA
jgi:hypothetical protein